MCHVSDPEDFHGSAESTKEGAWIHRLTHRFVWVDDHAGWIQQQGNAIHIGIPGDVIRKMSAINPVHASPCRAAILMLAMDAGLIRFRRHGEFCNLESTCAWTETLLGAEPFLRSFLALDMTVNIYAISENTRFSAPWQTIQVALDKGNIEELCTHFQMPAGVDSPSPS